MIEQDRSTDHDCDQFNSEVKEIQARSTRVDLVWRCDECGRRWRITGGRDHLQAVLVRSTRGGLEAPFSLLLLVLVIFIACVLTFGVR